MSNLKSWSRIPLPVKVVAFLLAGLALGVLFPQNALVNQIYLSGTYFPKIVVTLAAFVIFQLLAAAVAKLILIHKDRAGRTFGVIFTMYVVMGAVSLVWAACWIAFLSGLPFSLPGVEPPGPAAWATQIGHTFANVLSQQPLLQALLGGIFAGWLTARVRSLNRIAHGFIAAGDAILMVFRKLIWYYPIMIGCLAIGIPMNFGSKGIALYGTGVVWDTIVVGIWCALMVLFCRLCTKRTWKQIAAYYGTVWPTGFGTAGSYDTLAVNILSAEHDLGLDADVAEVSIVLGTVLNKNCTTMSVLIVTVISARLLNVPLSMMEIVMMIPPVMVLGLETPGIPGAAGYFMSPIIAVLLNVPDQAAWVTTFAACYSGLIPMMSAAGNTTDDGVAGALLQDRFGHLLGKRAPAAIAVGAGASDA